MKTSSDRVSIDPSFRHPQQKHAAKDLGFDWHSGRLDRSSLRADATYERLIHKTATFCSFRSVLRACRDTGNGKKGTKPSPQQDKAAANAAGRKAASAVPGSELKMAEGNQSPPKAEVDDSPLQHSMDRNKECEYIFPFNIASQNLSVRILRSDRLCRPDLSQGLLEKSCLNFSHFYVERINKLFVNFFGNIGINNYFF